MAQFQYSDADYKDIHSLAKAYNVHTINRSPDGGAAKPLRTTRSIDKDPQKAITTFSMSEIMQGSAITKPLIAPYDAFNQITSRSLSDLFGDPKGKPEAVLGNQAAIVPDDILNVAGKKGAQILDGSVAGTGTTAPGAPLPPGSDVATVINEAQKQIGKPYIWGAAGPDSFDCSGLTMWCWKAAGVYLPHYSGSQYDATEHIDMSQIEPGDLIFYESPGQHVALYIGNGQLINAPHSGAKVRYDSIDYWKTTRLASRPRKQQ